MIDINQTPPKKNWPKPTYPMKFCLDQWVLHLETHGKYLITALPDDRIIKTDKGWKPAYGYRPEHGGPECCRAQVSMEDGRFVVTDPPETILPSHEAVLEAISRG